MAAPFRHGAGLATAFLVPGARPSRVDDLAVLAFFGSGATQLTAAINATVAVAGTTRVRERVTATINATAAFSGATRMRRRATSSVDANVAVAGTTRVRERVTAGINATVAVAGTTRVRERVTASIPATVTIAGSTQMRARTAATIGATVGIASTPTRRLVGAFSVALGASVAGAPSLRSQHTGSIDLTTAVDATSRMRRRLTTSVPASVLIEGQLPGGAFLISTTISLSSSAAAAMQVRRGMGATLPLTTAIDAATSRRLSLSSGVDASTFLAGGMDVFRLPLFMSALISASVSIEASLHENIFSPWKPKSHHLILGGIPAGRITRTAGAAKSPRGGKTRRVRYGN